MTYAPSYWIPDDEWEPLLLCMSRGDAESIVSILDRAPTVPRESTDISVTLLGEMLNLLANHGVKFGNFSRVRGLRVLLLTVSRDEASAARTALGEFGATATDEMLADSDLAYGIILHANEPDLVRAGINYLVEGLQLPAGYAGLVVTYG